MVVIPFVCGYQDCPIFRTSLYLFNNQTQTISTKEIKHRLKVMNVQVKNGI
jgi:hypothetical protein